MLFFFYFALKLNVVRLFNLYDTPFVMIFGFCWLFSGLFGFIWLWVNYGLLLVYLNVG